MIKTLNYLFVTCFGIGSFRYGPGTITSLVTTVFLFCLCFSYRFEGLKPAGNEHTLILDENKLT